MKMKENAEFKTLTPEKTQAPKPRSLRPMRSLVAVRSLKPRTQVAQFMAKPDEMVKH
jgi:hypothetical protein